MVDGGYVEVGYRARLWVWRPRVRIPLLALILFLEQEEDFLYLILLGCRQAVKAQDFDSCIRGFESRQPRDYSSRISVKTEVGLLLAY